MMDFWGFNLPMRQNEEICDLKTKLAISKRNQNSEESY